MKFLSGAINQFGQEDIKKLESEERYAFDINGEEVVIGLEDVEISTNDIPGWSVANQDHVTVALDLTVTSELQEEGLARELVNRIQNLRKEKGLQVTDRIILHIENNVTTNSAFENFKDYICSETLAKLRFEDSLNNGDSQLFELVDGIEVKLALRKE